MLNDMRHLGLVILPEPGDMDRAGQTHLKAGQRRNKTNGSKKEPVGAVFNDTQRPRQKYGLDNSCEALGA